MFDFDRIQFVVNQLLPWHLCFSNQLEAKLEHEYEEHSKNQKKAIEQERVLLASVSTLQQRKQELEHSLKNIQVHFQALQPR